MSSKWLSMNSGLFTFLNFKSALQYSLGFFLAFLNEEYFPKLMMTSISISGAVMRLIT